MENIPLYVTPVGEKKKSFIGNMIILNNITKYKEIDSAKTNFISDRLARDENSDRVSIMMSFALVSEDSRLGPPERQRKPMRSAKTATGCSASPASC